MLALGFAAAAAGLTAARHWRMLPEAVFGLLWVCAALLPPFVGLGWDYVQLGHGCSTRRTWERCSSGRWPRHVPSAPSSW